MAKSFDERVKALGELLDSGSAIAPREKTHDERISALEGIVHLLRIVYDRDTEVRAQNAMNELLDKLKLG